MSNRALAWAEAQVTGNPLRKAVLMVLADKADEADSCYPSQELIARITEQSISSVGRHLRTLEKGGFISREARHKDDGSRNSDRYVLPVAMVAAVARPERPVVTAPTGQSDHRSERPPVRVTAYQTGSDQGELSLPVRVTGGQSDQGSISSKKELIKDSPSNTDAERAPTGSTDPRFVAFWDACPRKVGKADALRKYQLAIRRGATSAELLDGIRRYARTVADKDPQYIAHPATWLHQGRWEDEPHRPARTGTDSVPEYLR